MYRGGIKCLGELQIWDTSLNPNTILSQAATDDDQK